MSNIQQLRKLAVKLSATGTAEQISAPFRLYKNSYGFVLIQCYMPVTQNTTHAPICTVFKTSINLAGERKKGEGNYNMINAGEVILDGFKYLVFEIPMPREFTDTEGDLDIIFNYANTDGQGKALSILTSNIFNTTVSAGGWNDEGVQLDITSQEAAQINANKIAIGQLQQEQDNFINEMESLIEEAENAIKNFADTPNIIDNNFVVENSTTVFKQTSKTPSTNIETTFTKPIPVATIDNDGQMSKDDVIAIQKLNQRVNALENIGIIFSVTISENPTQEELTDLFITAANVEIGAIPPDGTQLKDVSQGITYQFFASSGLWELLSTPQIGLATNDSPGLVQGSLVPGQIYIESDGKQSVNDWDTVKTDIKNNKENITAINTELDLKFALPSGGTETQVLSGTGTLITPSATPISGGIVPFTNGGAYAQLALKQDKLTSGINIKTLNNESLLGSGNIKIGGISRETLYDLRSNPTVLTTTPQLFTIPIKYLNNINNTLKLIITPEYNLYLNIPAAFVEVICFSSNVNVGNNATLIWMNNTLVVYAQIQTSEVTSTDFKLRLSMGSGTSKLYGIFGQIIS